MKNHSMLPSAGAVLQVACAVRRTVAMLDGSADMLERLAEMAASDVAGDLYRHAEAIRAIRRQVAGPPLHERSHDRAGDPESHFETGTAD